MRVGGGNVPANCEPETPVELSARLLTSVGVLTVASAGNKSQTTGISMPGCHASIIAVGSLLKDGTYAPTSNSSDALDLWAPGDSIVAAFVPNSIIPCYFVAVQPFLARCSGTSMAAPHVAGAIAVMRQRYPNASSAAIRAALTGPANPPFTDPRNGITRPRLDLTTAMAQFELYRNTALRLTPLLLKDDP